MHYPVLFLQRVWGLDVALKKEIKRSMTFVTDVSKHESFLKPAYVVKGILWDFVQLLARLKNRKKLET